MFRLILFLICLAVVYEAFAKGEKALVEQPDIDATVYTVAYPSEKAAALEALSLAMSQHYSKCYEWAGVIYRHNGKFYFSQPVTSHKTDTVLFNVTAYDTDPVVSWYHTHTSRCNRSILPEPFSPDDIETTVKNQWSGAWLGITDTKEVKLFRPLRDIVKSDGSANGVVIRRNSFLKSSKHRSRMQI